MALPRALHEAAASGDAACVTRLLQSGADPTIAHVAYAGKVAYDVALDGRTRDAFRLFMRQRPSEWEWVERAHVPCGLTEAEEAEAERQRATEAKEKKKRKEADRKASRLCSPILQYCNSH